ncbi:MAG: exodeoxyribonuclease VII large subunit [Campylobacterales bacterium]|nr:exodeoxyribonuclease VII large subunit [Campylobacterales bacterium]
MASNAMMSVTSLNNKIKSLLETTFVHILVEGEVSSATYHTSGHLYFTIKDNESSLKCVMFKSSAIKLKFRIETGQHIIIEGSLGVFVPRGEYQFYAVHIEPYGKGALALAYEQLKEKLSQKGYFDPSRKKAIPKIVQSVALVTAKDSAALHDMLKIIDKRWPLLEVTIVDTLVQGEQAPIQIAKAIRYADLLNVDVIVTGRGGGSSEDLWAFNSEIVADAIFEAKTPIVSAVGHEIDVMISDFVADLRAPTPSAAMEMILPDKQEILQILDTYFEDLKNNTIRNLSLIGKQLESALESMKRNSPYSKIAYMEQQYREIKDDMMRISRFLTTNFEKLPDELENNLKNQFALVSHQKEYLLEELKKHFILSNPALRCTDGWAQVLVDNRLSKLDDIEIGQQFVLEDNTTKLVVVCEDKSKIYR